MDFNSYWQAVLEQDADAMRKFFSSGAVINWHNTNERFTVEEFLRANCEYPGKWRGEVERLEWAGELAVAVVHVYSRENSLSFHVTSFLQIQEDKIASIDEYWGEDGPAPEWRQDKRIGRPIR